MSRGLVDQNGKLLTADEITRAFYNDEIIGVRLKMRLEALENGSRGDLPMFAKLTDMQGTVNTIFIVSSVSSPFNKYHLEVDDYRYYYELD